MTSALAVVRVRNDAPYLQFTLPALIEQGFEVVVVDHSSRDESRSIGEHYLGNGVLEVIDLAWSGQFDLNEHLQLDEDIRDQHRHDWFASFAADEWPQARSTGSLLELLTEAKASRFGVINFEEFVFVPRPGMDYLGANPMRAITSYYHFAPSLHRQQRIWKRSLSASNRTSGGHRVNVPKDTIWPVSQNLRHYIGLSRSHAWLKRAQRSYPEESIERGWHHNRLNMPHSLCTRELPLMEATPWNSPELDTSRTWVKHFWEP